MVCIYAVIGAISVTIILQSVQIFSPYKQTQTLTDAQTIIFSVLVKDHALVLPGLCLRQCARVAPLNRVCFPFAFLLTSLSPSLPLHPLPSLNLPTIPYLSVFLWLPLPREINRGKDHWKMAFLPHGLMLNKKGSAPHSKARRVYVTKPFLGYVFKIVNCLGYFIRPRLKKIVLIHLFSNG